MTILMVGGTGKVGSGVVSQLVAKGAAAVRVLSTDPAKANVPDGVAVVQGDVLDISSTRTALEGIDTLFLLNPVVADELTRALLTLRLAKDAGVKGVVYVSMVNADTFADTPHVAAKYAAELLIERFELPATILRPNCFFQNDAKVKDPLREGVYAMPIGTVGVAMVDMRDVAEVAALELIRRDRAADPLPRTLVEVSGPEILTGPAIATIWSKVLGRPVRYAGDDTGPLEVQSGAAIGTAMAFDTVLMFRGFQRDGMLPAAGAAEAAAEMLGRPLRSYRAFAEELAASFERAPEVGA